jgi:hypothetical protein
MAVDPDPEERAALVRNAVRERKRSNNLNGRNVDFSGGQVMHPFKG